MLQHKFKGLKTWWCALVIHTYRYHRMTYDLAIEAHLLGKTQCFVTINMCER